MTTFLLDSNILIDFFKKRREAIGLISKLARESDLAASILSVTELRAGWTEEQAKILLPRFYRLFNVEDVSPEIAELAGKLRRQYKEKGLTLPAIDTLIGATVIIHDYHLVTRNKKDFPMPEIRFYEFVD